VAKSQLWQYRWQWLAALQWHGGGSVAKLSGGNGYIESVALGYVSENGATSA